MILPIMAYGSPVLRQESVDVHPDYPGLTELIANMWDTMYNATGCGLAAPQVNNPINLFVIDSKPTYDGMTAEDKATYFDGDQGVKELFINPHITYFPDRYWSDDEGCLSIPGLVGSVKRPWQIAIEYQDENFVSKNAIFNGMTARMIQHEYDHLGGKLYLDHLSPLSKQLMNRKLSKILNGKYACKYPLKHV
ncbi:peptide deformylase [Mucilaginibacter roseus]|uniref:Peptide deformylase n=1 Tax=Mucilaginibacter roseus TaxID=1528868 RepID=A0ABS8TWU1_9SPHI|nr:peptide deformylase [Mucilaginibacter roseus]MCD8739346.1 peptide deformylase [Mucilaginibacter roseus]